MNVINTLLYYFENKVILINLPVIFYFIITIFRSKIR